MLKHYVIPLEPFDLRNAETFKRLEPLGIDRQGLVAYCFHFATASDYQTLRMHLMKDMREVIDSDPMLSGYRGAALRDIERTVNQCIDWIGGACASLAELVRIYTGSFNETVRLVQFVGDDVLISIDDDPPMRLAYEYPLPVSATAL